MYFKQMVEMDDCNPLHISPSRVHDIIKSFKKFVETFVYKGQEHKPKLDMCEF